MTETITKSLHYNTKKYKINLSVIFWRISYYNVLWDSSHTSHICNHNKNRQGQEVEWTDYKKGLSLP